MEVLLMLAVAISLVCIIGMALMYRYANNKCKHIWMNVLEDGFQYCDICGVARKPIDETYTKKCMHRFVEDRSSPINRTNKITGDSRIIGYLHVLKCKNCGDIQYRKIEIGD